MTTLTEIIVSAKELKEVAVTAYDAVVAAEGLVDDKGEKLDGVAKKAYAVAVVADEFGDQIGEVGDKLDEFINKLVGFLNSFGWASTVVSYLTTALSILAYAPDVIEGGAMVIAKLADLIFEAKTGDNLNTETGEITEGEDE